MAFEIELKAWVPDFNDCRRSLAAIMNFEYEYVKEDAYWFPVGNSGFSPKSGIRVRKETDITENGSLNFVIATYKLKEVRERIEINDEYEFNVSGGDQAEALAAFEGFLKMTGFSVGYTKRKSGFLYKLADIKAELSLVERLGWFIELETMRDNNNKATLGMAQKRLLKLLGDIGINESAIEANYYSELLKKSSAELC